MGNISGVVTLVLAAFPIMFFAVVPLIILPFRGRFRSAFGLELPESRIGFGMMSGAGDKRLFLMRRRS